MRPPPSRPPMALVVALATTLSLAAMAIPAAAQQKLTGAELDRLVTGKTVFYNRQGSAFGAEQYLPGRRVIWAFVDGTCQQGEWYEEDGAICFKYLDQPGDICWSFFSDGDSIRARVLGDDPALDLMSVAETEEPLRCTPPGLGT